MLGALLAIATQPTDSFAAGPSTFTIHSSISEVMAGSSKAGCVGGEANLAPGVTRCLVFVVDNQMDQQITVRRIRMELDPDFPAPPQGCSSDELVLPAFSGALVVPASGTASTGGLPIRLRDTADNQDPCKNSVLHFRFSGSAVYGEPGGSGTPSGGGLAYTGAGMSGALVSLGAVLVLAGWSLLASLRRPRPRTGAAP